MKTRLTGKAHRLEKWTRVGSSIKVAWSGVLSNLKSSLEYFCSNAIEKGMSIHEVANQAGESNIHTTMLYTNPTKKKCWRK
jgi:hypothetical protein